MEALFLKLVNMSITASWLVLAIIAVRCIFKKAPKWILCLLWGLVAFRLICLSFSSAPNADVFGAVFHMFPAGNELVRKGGEELDKACLMQ